MPLRLFGLIFAVILIVVVVLVFLLGGSGGGGSKQAQTAVTPTPGVVGSGPAELAVGKYVQATLGKEFVEDCTKADPAKDAGKVCSDIKGNRENQRAFQLTAVGAKPSLWIIVGEKTPGQWEVAGTSAITPDNAAVPGIPWPLRTGVEVLVIGANPCVNVREGPSLQQKAVDCIRDGTKIRLTAGPAPADDLQWWQVEGRTGWVASDYLRYPDAAQ